jgi:hypothetical protein
MDTNTLLLIGLFAIVLHSYLASKRASKENLLLAEALDRIERKIGTNAEWK